MLQRLEPRLKNRLLWLALLVATALPLPVLAADVTVFAAASLVDVLDDLSLAFTKNTGIEVAVVAGASSTMARQIEAGAPADLFISADHANAQAVAKSTGGPVIELFGNRLVIIGPADSAGEITLEQLPEKLGGKRLALGDPSHVPAGIYAREALQAAGVWPMLEDQLAPAGDVRGAVSYLAQGLAPFGIVYATDAGIGGVRIVGRIEASLHAPIRYWGVQVVQANAAATAFLAFVQGGAGQRILADAGFATSTRN